MRKRILGAVAGLGMAMACGAQAQTGAQTGAGAVDPVETATRGIIDRFDAAIRECGLTPPFVPGVAMVSSSTLVSYDTERHLVQQSSWADMPPEIQGLVAAWAEAGTLGLSPEGQFGEIFNSLLVPHELGHYVAQLDGRLEQEDSWTNEILANRIAIAFWSLDPEGRAAITDRVANFTGFLNALPNPVPEGEDPHAYFEANYAALGADPAAYGWYQGAFMTTAWSLRDEDTFCGLVKPAA